MADDRDLASTVALAMRALLRECVGDRPRPERLGLVCSAVVPAVRLLEGDIRNIDDARAIGVLVEESLGWDGESS